MAVDDTGMHEEFGTMARWTHEVLGDVGPDAAIPAACRGSGRPSGLDWLLDGMALRAGMLVLDLGAGLGGPAAYARARAHIVPVCLDPMSEASEAASAVFGLAAMVGEGTRLPFAPGSFDAAWSLGTLCTTHEKSAWLAELRRVLRPGSPLGLLVLVSTSASFGVSWGNAFPSTAELDGLLAGAGFQTQGRCWSDELPDGDERWHEAEARVGEAVRRRHRDDPRLRRIEQQEERMGELLDAGRVRGLLLVARAV